MGHTNLRESMIICGIENLFRKFVVTLQIERFFRNFFLFHQIRIVFQNPLYPSIAIHDDEMLGSQNKIGYNLAIKISFQVIANDLLECLQLINAHSLPIALPQESFEGCLRTDRSFFLYLDILLQTVLLFFKLLAYLVYLYLVLEHHCKYFIVSRVELHPSDFSILKFYKARLSVQQFMSLDIHNYYSSLGDTTTHKQVFTVQRKLDTINLECADIFNLDRTLLFMDIAERNVGIFPIISQYDQASLMVGSKRLICPPMWIELYLCLPSLKIQSIEHVIRNTANGGHEYELKLISREKECATKLIHNYCRLMRVSYIFNINIQIKHSQNQYLYVCHIILILLTYLIIMILNSLLSPRSILSLQRNLHQFAMFCTIQDVRLVKPNGKLSIVATPIGNLSDLTPNIIKCLFKADLIGCQDRRVAGQLYTLIKNRNIIQKMEQKFGTLGLTNLVLSEEENQKQGTTSQDQTQKSHQLYNYSNMSDKERRKFLSKMSLQDQKKFKIDYLKYRAKKIVNKQEEFLYKSKDQKYDQLYGIQVSDYQQIEAQIFRTRAKKGRGLLIPLNTYSETKLFDLVRKMLQSKHIAIVSDAGMPCISDPGWKMVQMIRQTMPTVPIQVVGGPSAIDIMLTLARITTKSNSLSGRFEGFASPEISNITEQNMTYNKYLQQAKEKDFSIHFINSKKIKKAAYTLQRIYGQSHQIIMTNQLTKKFERKFNGTLKQLTDHLSNENKQFDGVGQLSYLLHSKNTKVEQLAHKKENIEQKKDTQTKDEKLRIQAINVNEFINSLSETGLSSKEKAQLVSSVFGLKLNQSKKLVYANLSVNNSRKE